MKISIESIEHAQQRYSTIGDWVREGDGGLRILVSDLGNEFYNRLVAIHELIEETLCLKRGIKQSEVDAFDQLYEKERGPGDETEPGDSLRAPYRDEHCAATGVERLVCSMLGISWALYEEAVLSELAGDPEEHVIIE